MPVPRAFRTELERDEVFALASTGRVRLFVVGRRFRIVRADLRCPSAEFEVDFETWWQGLVTYRCDDVSRLRRVVGDEVFYADGTPDRSPHLRVVGDERDPSYASVAWTDAGYRACRMAATWAARVQGQVRR